MYFAKWKKPDPKVYIVCDLIYKTFWKRRNYRDGNMIYGRQEGRMGKGDTTNRLQGNVTLSCGHVMVDL